MRMKSIILIMLTSLASMVQAATVVNFDAVTQVINKGANFSSAFALNTASPKVAADGVNYVGADVYGAMNERAVGIWAVADSGGSGLKVRMNNSTANGVDGLFLFKTDAIEFAAGNDSLSATSHASKIQRLASAQIRFVVEDAGQFYISEPNGEYVTGGTEGQVDTFTTNALAIDWFNYDPVSDATNVAVIGTAATPAFTDIDFIGFALFADGPATGGGGVNFGVRQFTAQGTGSVIVDPWTKLEFWDFEDGAGNSFNQFTNSGTLGSLWNNGAIPELQTDAVGNLVLSNQTGQLFRKVPKAGTANASATADEYATPFTSGKYRLEMDLAAWALDASAAGSTLTFSTKASEATSSAVAAGIRVKIQDETTARFQLFHSGSNFRSFDFGLTNSAGIELAIEFDYNVGTAIYYTNGVQTHSFNNFTNDYPVATLLLNTDTSWSSNSIVKINEMGFSWIYEALAPVLAVDFNAADVTNNVQYEYVDFALNLGAAPQLTLPNYLGQPIYAGLELDPVNGWTTGVDNGGAYTNGGSISFGKNTSGAKIQWNGPGGAAPGDDFGRYEEDDVATGVFLFKQEDFLNDLDSGTVFMNATNDTISATVQLNPKSPARLKSGKFRWVVKDAGNYYISAEVTNLTTEGSATVTAEALDVAWFDYDPESSANAISISASPTLQSIDALGFWLQATILTNNGDRAYPSFQCSSFQAAASKPPILSPTANYAAWIGGYPGVGANAGLQDHGDSDGLDNLTEYAFGGDPSVANDLLINTPVQAPLSGATNVIEYIYFERDDADARGLASILTVGTDLVYTNWADGSSYEEGRGASDVSGYNAVTNWIPTDGADQQFIRLQIEFTP
jgi:hypothetical protein